MMFNLPFSEPERWRSLPKGESPVMTRFGWPWTVLTVGSFGLSLYWIEIGDRTGVNGWQGILGGAIVGIAQDLWLRRQGYSLWGWSVASAIAWGLLGTSGIGALGWVVPQGQLIWWMRIFLGVLGGSIVGCIVGTCQGIVLKPYLDQPWRWVVLSMRSWAIALGVGWTVGCGIRLGTRLFLGDVLGLVIAWWMVAMMTGTMLDRWLRAPRST